MAMKKLYAKTSFTSKKSHAPAAPILAYQQAPAAAAMCEFQAPREQQQQQQQQPELLIKRSQSLYHKRAPGNEYYSIEELQELDLLDYRHPMYHHYQQQQQPQRALAAHYEHEQLVLQLPKAIGAMPTSIYDAPNWTQQQSQSLVNDQLFEQSIIGARASVMVYDDNQKKWVPSGSSSGLSKVQIYHHQQNNTFRVVGRKLQDHEVVINCSIMKGLKYNQATATFHQWRDSKFVYGLNFSSQSDAENFARAMMHALEVLSGRVVNNPTGQPTNGNGYEEDMGYRTMTSEDAAILRQNNGIAGHITPSAQTPTSQTNQNNIPQSPPTPQGHHRTSRNSLSAPPAPQPPPLQQQQQQQLQQQQQQQQPGSHYGPTGNGPTSNGLPPQGNQQMQIPPAPGQTQQQQQQQYQQQPIYSSQQQQQQLVQAGFAPSQYQQPHYVLSNSNPNLNLHQYPSQPQPPMPPAHQNGGGPIYGATQPAHIPSSASANSVVYASQPQLMPQPPQAPAYGQHNGQQPPPLQQQQQQQENPYGQAPLAPPMMQQPVGAGVPMPPPLNRMSSTGSAGVVQAAPAPPPPPPTFGGAPPAPPQMFNGAPAPPQPPAPPAPPAMGPPGGPGAPPPPPPPPGLGAGGPGKKDDPQADLMGSLASQLQQFKLKKKGSTTSAPENSGSSTSSGGSGNYGTIGRSSNGMASMMDEMAKTLARRRAQAEKKEPDPEPEVKQRPWEKSNTLPHKLSSGGGGGGNNNGAASNAHGGANGSNGSGGNNTGSGGESPRPMRKRFGSASEETILKVNGDGLSLALSNSDLDSLKAEIVREMRLEIQKVKNEIIDAIKSEFNRR
ncbi:protein enabled isoform X3 [Drosophila busckii]|uniref:protein enabled isoform X3 n=1 Tax=Drosophila busckii TaxID=30019 RepID=UPI00083EB89F|nr:protein enabled isoform X3 [Drosophila busckii]